MLVNISDSIVKGYNQPCHSQRLCMQRLRRIIAHLMPIMYGRYKWSSVCRLRLLGLAVRLSRSAKALCGSKIEAPPKMTARRPLERRSGAQKGWRGTVGRRKTFWDRPGHVIGCQMLPMSLRAEWMTCWAGAKPRRLAAARRTSAGVRTRIVATSPATPVVPGE